VKCAYREQGMVESLAECSTANGPRRARLKAKAEYLRRKLTLRAGNVLAFLLEWIDVESIKVVPQVNLRPVLFRGQVYLFHWKIKACHNQ